MKRVTKYNLIRLVGMMTEYKISQDEELLKEINDFIENVINKDKSYFKKLQSYDFDNETLKYLI